jgi:hypothetical protein
MDDDPNKEPDTGENASGLKLSDDTSTLIHAHDEREQNREDRWISAQIQFPLCGLAFSPSRSYRLHCLRSYGIVGAGRFLVDCATGYKPGSSIDIDKRIVEAGAEAIKAALEPNMVEMVLREWTELERFKTDFEAKHGADALVRIKAELASEACEHEETEGGCGGFTYDQFSALAAIRSVIGTKRHPVCIRRDFIRCRMLGYKASSVMLAELGARTDQAKPRADHQIKYLLRILEKRRFFLRASLNKRQTFFAIGMTPEALRSEMDARSHASELALNEPASDERSSELPPQPQKRFQKPTIEEVKLQATEVGLSEHEAEKFYAYYESNGWHVGRNPMKKWHAAMTNWKLNVRSSQPGSITPLKIDHSKGF